VAGERQSDVEHVICRDRRSQVVDGLVANINHRRCLGFGGERDRDHPHVLALGARDLDQGLVVMMRHHLELAIGQALPTLGALKPTSLPAKDIEQIHANVPTRDFRWTNSKS